MEAAVTTHKWGKNALQGLCESILLLWEMVLL